VNPHAEMDEKEWRFVLAHEMLHAALRHSERVGGRDPYLWNVACDYYVINGWLVEMRVGAMPAGLLHDPASPDYRPRRCTTGSPPICAGCASSARCAARDWATCLASRCRTWFAVRDRPPRVPPAGAGDRPRLPRHTRARPAAACWSRRSAGGRR